METVIVTTPTGTFDVEVVADLPDRWRVVCQGIGCDRHLDIAKVTTDHNGTTHHGAITARGCVSHPPHTWAAYL